MIAKETKIFKELLEHFQEKYPHRQIKMMGYLISVDGEYVCNTDGYNLLYCVTKLTEALACELR